VRRGLRRRVRRLRGLLVRPGVGLGWRPETAWACERRADLALTEVIAESVPTRGPIPAPLRALLDRGVPIIPHGVSLSLGSGDPPCPRRLARLREVAIRLDAPFVSEHLAFVRGGGVETEHLLPVRRTADALDVVVDNVLRAQDALGLPIAIENIAQLYEASGTMDEASFLRALTLRTGCKLLLDVSNLHANALNFGWDVEAWLDCYPLERVAYVHVAGGAWCGEVYRDTHAHPVSEGPLALLASLARRGLRLPTLLERDDGFGSREALYRELDAIDAAWRRDGEEARRVAG